MEWWPIVKMPVCWNLDDFAWSHSCHGCHPLLSRLRDVRLDPSMGGVGGIVSVPRSEPCQRNIGRLLTVAGRDA